MTRATLLQLLANPTALTGTDVRALEQLAQAFPYCQTAHLLLAKAAHDQSSMLAGQRLRRAATYAADRTRLRQLIELPAPVEAPALLADAVVSVVPPLALTPTADALSNDSGEQSLSIENQDTIQVVSVLLEDKPDQIIGSSESVATTPEPVAAESVAEDEQLAQAPPIRPPVEAEVAHLEFGLAAEEPAEIIAYRLPEPDEESLPVVTMLPPATPRLPVFSGLAEVHYAPSAGSRLGFALVSADATEALPGASLPPANEFFAPDALLLAHLAAHQPPAPPKASSLDLINSFLQRAPAPARRRVAPLPSAPEPDEQADLSVRSTRAESDLASEGLAKIFTRQGKTDRAIAVYERLMVKHPEKMAYFAAQIDSLRPSA